MAVDEDLLAERVARNDAIFRDANERIRNTAVQHDLDGLVPFICECADPSCTDLAPLSLPQYEAIRAEPTRFLNIPGHERAGRPFVRVVEVRERYLVVQKIGHAAEVAEELDPRANDHV